MSRRKGVGNLTNCMCMGWVCRRKRPTARTVVLKLAVSLFTLEQYPLSAWVGPPQMTLTDITLPLMTQRGQVMRGAR